MFDKIQLILICIHYFDFLKYAVNRAIDSYLYLCRTQPFKNANKRTALLVANAILIKNGSGLLHISENQNGEYKLKLIVFYETNKPRIIKKFLYNYCWYDNNFKPLNIYDENDYVR